MQLESDYNKHLLTAKHKLLTNTDEKIRKNPEKPKNPKKTPKNIIVNYATLNAAIKKIIIGIY